MKAPEKIYINDFGSELSYDWHIEHCCESDIEYTRTDAFVDKACSWLENNLQGIVGGDIYIEDFVKFLKGE